MDFDRSVLLLAGLLALLTVSTQPQPMHPLIWTASCLPLRCDDVNRDLVNTTDAGFVINGVIPGRLSSLKPGEPLLARSFSFVRNEVGRHVSGSKWCAPLICHSTVA